MRIFEFDIKCLLLSMVSILALSLIFYWLGESFLIEIAEANIWPIGLLFLFSMIVFQVKSKIFKVIFIIFASLSLGTFLYEYINSIAFTYSFNPKLEVHTISWNVFLPKVVIANFTGFVLFSATQFYYCSMCVLKYGPNVSSINIDNIPHNDQEWITDIKTRKQRGEKLNAYSKEGTISARRKAKALGIEECFVEFLSEEDVRERRGW